MQTAMIRQSISDAIGGTRTEAKTQALSWLAAQLRWEDTLGVLREDETDAAVAKAA